MKKRIETELTEYYEKLCTSCQLIDSLLGRNKTYLCNHLNAALKDCLKNAQKSSFQAFLKEMEISENQLYMRGHYYEYEQSFSKDAVTFFSMFLYYRNSN